MRLLLCTDGSIHGQAALAFGALIAKHSSTPATLLGVLEQPDMRTWLQHCLSAGERHLQGAPSPRLKLRRGHAAEEILNELTEERYDLIVVGAHGRRGITRFLLGSTAERVVRHASMPVLIVREAPDQLQRILICTAGAEQGLADVAFGGQIAHLTETQVTVLHVMSQIAATSTGRSTFLADLEASAKNLIARKTREGKHLQQALTILTELAVPAKVRVRHGLVVDEILAEMTGGAYDLVIVGAHESEGFRRFLLDDVTQQIISHSHGPVLVVKGAIADFDQLPLGESHEG